MDTIPSKEEMEQALRQRIGRDLQSRFAESVVAVCGLGGLGSNLAFALARAGIGTLLLIDFDRVDISNLNRQQYKAAQIGMEKTQALAENLREAAPYTRILTYTERITEANFRELLSGADIICEAFDNAADKSMLANAVLENMPSKYLVAASGMAGMEPANSIRTRRITGHFYLCGDGVSDADAGMSLVSSRVMLCAAHQAHAVLRIAAGEAGI